MMVQTQSKCETCLEPLTEASRVDRSYLAYTSSYFLEKITLTPKLRIQNPSPALKISTSTHWEKESHLLFKKKRLMCLKIEATHLISLGHGE